MHRLLIAATLLAAAPLAAQGARDTPWLEGCWADGAMHESWVRRDNGRLLGAGTVLRGAERQVTERLRLVPRNERILYIAEPVGQLPTTFTAIAADADSLVVTNPAHDFPQRIAYRRAGGGALAVELTGVERGTPRTMRLDFQPRSSCAALGEVGVALAPPGSTLRLQLATARVTGTVVAFGATTVTLRRDETTQDIPLAAILGVERQRRSAGRGALLGAGIGGVALGGFLYWILGATCESTRGCQDDQWGGAGIGFLLGGATGALLGAGVGSLIPRWERMVP